MARINFRISDEAKQNAEKQAESIGLDLSEYTRMLYKLDLADLVKKTVEKDKNRG
jgi:antitoxin component of RelBE/YafQ-DinJ toxin-antitoxin module